MWGVLLSGIERMSRWIMQVSRGAMAEPPRIEHHQA
jgi:hypothetical protein